MRAASVQIVSKTRSQAGTGIWLLESREGSIRNARHVAQAFGAHHSNSPGTNHRQKDIDWNADFALLEYPPVECQQGELDTTDDAGVADF